MLTFCGFGIRAISEEWMLRAYAKSIMSWQKLPHCPSWKLTYSPPESVLFGGTYLWISGQRSQPEFGGKYMLWLPNLTDLCAAYVATGSAKSEMF
jgi:hypothetical protein